MKLAFPIFALLAAAAVASAGIADARPAKPAAPACHRPAFRVILDVGHTAQEPGAVSARGVPEYDFNLRLARRIEAALVKAGFAHTVLLLTDGAAQPALLARVQRANAMQAQLFVSIHHDSVPEFLLAAWEFLGADGRFSDRFKGHALFVSRDNARFRQSLAFAQLLGRALKSHRLEYTPHYTLKLMGPRRRLLVDARAGVYRFDQLVVLKDARMPAVLLEAGSIVNRAEELSMESPERQALIAAAMVEAVEKFCAAGRQ